MSVISTSPILRSIICFFTVMALLANPVSGYTYNFSIETLDGNEISLSVFQGEYLLVEGMTTWCESCKAQIEPLKDVYTYLGDNLTLIMIALDLESDTPAKLEDYKETYDISWEIYIDHKQEVADFYGIDSYPAIYLFDREGNIAKKWSGYTSAQTLIDEISSEIGVEVDYSNSDLANLYENLKNNIAFLFFFGTFVAIVAYSLIKKLLLMPRS